MRSSPAAVTIGLLHAVPGMLAVVLLWSTAGRSLHGSLGVLVDVAFWAYVVLRTLGVPLSWLTTRWHVDHLGVRFRTGLLGRQETVVRWEEVVSVDVSQPSLHRLLGCYAVRFGLGSTQKAAVRLEAVSRTTRDDIAGVAREAQLRPGRPEAATDRRHAAPPPTAPAEVEIYRIKPRDYLLVSLTYGSFALFVPAVWSALDQVGDWVRLPLPDLGVVLTWPRAVQLAAGLAVLTLAVAYGWLVTWLRYRGFRVVRSEQGYLASGGLLSSQVRTVSADRVVGLKVTQNPLMRALGYGRVSVLTRDAGDQPMANLLFPLARLDTLPAALGPTPVHPEVATPTLRLSVPARAAAAATALVGWVGLLAVAHLLRPEWFLATGTVATVVVALVLNGAWVVAESVTDRPVCYVRRGVWWVSHVEFATGAIQVAESSQGLFGRLTGTWSVVLHYYDGRVRRVRALGCSPAQRQRLTAPVLR